MCRGSRTCRGHPPVAAVGSNCSCSVTPQVFCCQPDVACCQLGWRCCASSFGSCWCARCGPGRRGRWDGFRPPRPRDPGIVGDLLRDPGQERIERRIASTRRRRLDGIGRKLWMCGQLIEEPAQLWPVDQPAVGILSVCAGQQLDRRPGRLPWSHADREMSTCGGNEAREHGQRGIARPVLDPGDSRGRHPSLRCERAAGQTRVFTGLPDQSGCTHACSLYATAGLEQCRTGGLQRAATRVRFGGS